MVVRFLHDILLQHRDSPETALVSGSVELSYRELSHRVEARSEFFRTWGARAGDRIAMYLPKNEHAVETIFAASLAGTIIVPINPVLRVAQVEHILRDSGARFLVTSTDRLRSLGELDWSGVAVETVVTIGAEPATINGPSVVSWSEPGKAISEEGSYPSVDGDLAGLMYTSGSTGLAKGVALSHRNFVAGAESVAEYLEISDQDRILAVLPLSFDAGFSQLTTGFLRGATVVLLDYVLPKDVVNAVPKFQISLITGVPPLWMQLVDLNWNEGTTQSVRVFANTGGKMPQNTLTKLRKIFPNAKPYLMYGLTEAFRSTYLPPDEIDKRPDSIGKAIPNSEILVVNSKGNVCAPGEIGELVHRGPLVALGYWNDPTRTAERFKPSPQASTELPLSEIAVWSGDLVKTDEEGYLYFVGRNDDMIKTSGYRVSPTEVEELAFATSLVSEAVAVGVRHERLGQAIVLTVKPAGTKVVESKLMEAYRRNAPSYMVPARIEVVQKLPRSPNGKIDRSQLRARYSSMFDESDP